MPGRAPDYRQAQGGSRSSSSITLGGKSRSAEELNALSNWKMAKNAMISQLVGLAPGLVMRSDEKIATNAARREKLEQAIASGQISGVEPGQEIRADDVGFVFEDDEKASDFWGNVTQSTGKGNLDRTRQVRNAIREKYLDSFQNHVNSFINIQDALKQAGIVANENTSEVFSNLLTSPNFGYLLNHETNLTLKQGRDGKRGILDYEIEDEDQKASIQKIANDILQGRGDKFKDIPNVDAGIFKRASEYFKEASSANASLDLNESYGDLMWNPNIEREVDRDAQYNDEIKTDLSRLIASYTMEGLTGMLGAGVGSNRPWSVDQAAQFAAQSRDRSLGQDDRLRSRYYTDEQSVREGAYSMDFGDAAARAAAAYSRSSAAGWDDTTARYHAPAANIPPPTYAMSLYGKTSNLTQGPNNTMVPEKNPTPISGRDTGPTGFQFTADATTPAGDNAVRGIHSWLRGNWNGFNADRLKDYYDDYFATPSLQNYKAVKTSNNTIDIMKGQRRVMEIRTLPGPSGSYGDVYTLGGNHNPIMFTVPSGTFLNDIDVVTKDTFTPN